MRLKNKESYEYWVNKKLGWMWRKNLKLAKETAWHLKRARKTRCYFSPANLVEWGARVSGYWDFVSVSVALSPSNQTPIDPVHAKEGGGGNTWKETKCNRLGLGICFAKHGKKDRHGQTNPNRCFHAWRPPTHALPWESQPTLRTTLIGLTLWAMRWPAPLLPLPSSIWLIKYQIFVSIYLSICVSLHELTVKSLQHVPTVHLQVSLSPHFFLHVARLSLVTFLTSKHSNTIHHLLLPLKLSFLLTSSPILAFTPAASIMPLL